VLYGISRRCSGWSEVEERCTCRELWRAKNIPISISVIRERADKYSRRPLCLMGSCGGVICGVLCLILVSSGEFELRGTSNTLQA
jgi:hypothetical protein